MVAAGVPRRRVDHARVPAELALDMRDVAARYTRVDGRSSHSSSVSIWGRWLPASSDAGIFIYDLWGDAVNAASRKESQGTAGEIQIGSTTYELLKEEFVCEPRGLVDVKGKGTIPTWYLVGPRRRPMAEQSVEAISHAEAV